MVIAIIGSSIACKSAVETLIPRLKDWDKLIIITRDRELFYSRVLLPNYIAGNLSKERLVFAEEDILNSDKVKVIKGNVLSIDTDTKLIEMENNDTVHYDKLLITTGASPSKMEVKNAHLPGIYYLRNLEDAEAIKAKAEEADRCTVLGGGLISLKVAWALNQPGKEVTVLVSSSQLLSRIADKTVSQMVQKRFEDEGVKIKFNARIKELTGDSSGVAGVVLEDRSVVEGKLIVIGKGVRPNMDIVADTGIKTDKGILVNSRMETSVKDVYAAGDVAQSIACLDDCSELFTLWPDAAFQGRVAASNILGMDKEYTGGLSMNSVVFYGTPFILIGMVREKDLDDCKVYARDNSKKGIYRKVVLKDNRLVGAIIAGDISYAGMVYWDIRSGREIYQPEDYLTLEGLNKRYIYRTSPTDTFTRGVFIWKTS